MRILAIRSVPLSRSSVDAWREAGVKFARRDNGLERNMELAARYDAVLNLGNSNIVVVPDTEHWNKPVVVSVTSSPVATRRHLGEWMPPSPEEGDTFWLKGPGRAGANKYKLTHFHGGDLIGYYLGDGFVVEKHVEGVEYRITAVNHRIVQQHIRLGENGDRSYQWIGSDVTPSPVRRVVKHAAHDLRSMMTDINLMLSWDVIYDTVAGDAYVLEANTSPGVNVHTAKRIIREMIRQMEEQADDDSA